MAILTDVQVAVNQLVKKQRLYKKYREYYDGDQPLAFATEKFNSAFGTLFETFADNLCSVVVDSMADRIKLEELAIDMEGEFPELEAALKDLITRNKLMLRAGELHQEAFRAGDAYIIVWPNKLGEAEIHVHRGDQMTVYYDEEAGQGTLKWAAKWWTEADGRMRLNMYYPDRLEKYRTGPSNFLGMVEDTRGFRKFETTAHGYGRVPVFHFPNNAGIMEFGRSELKDITPLQDALNKSVMDMLVAMEFVALPQRWVAGLELEKDKITGRVKWPFEAGVDRIWAVDDPETKFGEFPAADLQQFLNTQESFRMEIARISGTPLHYLMLSPGNFPSGESMKTAESRAISKTEDREMTFGDVWQEVIQFALWLDLTQDIPIKVKWKDTAPRSEKEYADTLLVHQQLKPVFLRRLGYTDEEIAELEEAQANEGQLALEMVEAKTAANPDEDANTDNEDSEGGDTSAQGKAKQGNP